MQQISFDEVVELIVSQDKRYHREAYQFVREALDHTQRIVPKPKRGQIRHVSGQELLQGFREYANKQFGPMTHVVLEDWGMHGCEDVGEIVFNMVESGLLAKTDDDSREHFKGGYEFAEAFNHPYLPAARQSGTKPANVPAPTPRSPEE